jgi:SNF2 family DNA or RNA helicase
MARSLGYQQLDRLREDLKPILLRRTRSEVARQLPDRTDQVVRIRPTAEQLEIHGAIMLQWSRRSFANAI